MEIHFGLKRSTPLSCGSLEMRKILVYCQHVLGIGHLARMASILQELRHGEVYLVLGGPPAEIAFPEHVHLIRLPGLCMDTEFSGLQPVEAGVSLEVVKQARKEKLLRIVDDLQPDLLLMELFPFGRCGFRFELDPLLSHVRRRYKNQCLAVSSVRDILVEREDQSKFEQRALDRLNTFFDLLLIHSDPEVIRFDQTFSRVHDIRIPIHYTGYIAERNTPAAGRRLRRSLGLAREEKLIVVSAGSGSVGELLLESSLAAHALLCQQYPVRLQLFTGPYLAENSFARLARQAGQGVVVERFSKRFTAWLRAADLSISMGGYNTTMNVVAAGCPALIFPFSQNREQGLRAERLSGRVSLQVLDREDLLPQRFAKIIENMLRMNHYSPTVILDGASETARCLLSLDHGRGSNGG